MPAGAPPIGGYAVPGAGSWATTPAGMAPPTDPLVPYDFSSLFDRMTGILKRSWRSMLTIQAIGTLVPAAVMLAVVAASGIGGMFLAGPTTMEPGEQLTREELERLLGLLAGVGILVLLLALVSAYLNSVAWAASIWSLTREAAGQPAPLREAFRFGFRRGLPLFGWYLLASLCVTVGALCCILPGVYLGVALSLIAPIMVFEGRNAFSRSFSLTHSNFWPVVGRVLLLFLVYLAYGFIVGLPNNFVNAVPIDDVAVQLVIIVVVQLITTALTLPAVVVLIAGLTVTYTELRARQEPLSTPQLAAELDRA